MRTALEIELEVLEDVLAKCVAAEAARKEEVEALETAERLDAQRSTASIVLARKQIAYSVADKQACSAFIDAGLVGEVSREEVQKRIDVLRKRIDQSETIQHRHYTLGDVQSELVEWQRHNFPGRPSWQPLVGAMEELGELSHAFLKSRQNIRTEQDHAANMRDAVADIIVYLCDFANAEGFSVEEELSKAWAKVRERDWQKNRTSEGK